MNVRAILAPALLMVLSARAEGIEPIAQRTAMICMELGAGNRFIVMRAETTATEMFAGIGVNLEWHHNERDCQARPEGPILVRLSTDTPDTKLPGALAYALPYKPPNAVPRTAAHKGTHIEVFYDRIAGTLEPKLAPSLLAHVLAHEVAHILQGVSRHSAEGIMKASWDEHDFLDMVWKPLAFTAEDARLIQLGTDARALQLANSGRITQADNFRPPH
jgi:hypothetical protein